MLSSLPKLADRAFIVGMFLPTLIFGIVLLVEFRDEATGMIDALKAVKGEQFGWETIIFLLVIWMFAIFILILNNSLYRILEGYNDFPKGLNFFWRWLIEWKKNRKRRYLESQLDTISRFENEWISRRDEFPRSPKFSQYRELRRYMALSWPSDVDSVMPTDFGNAIRAFENYSREHYGADAIVVWPRLSSVMSKEFCEQFQCNRSYIDFFVNSCFYFVLIAFVGIWRTVSSSNFQKLNLSPTDLQKLSSILTVQGDSDQRIVLFLSDIRLLCSWLWSFVYNETWLLWTAGGLIGAYASYRLAVMFVPAWGDSVKSAFDCYLPALAEQLGFELPLSDAKRREFWRTFSQQAIYGGGDESPFITAEWKRSGLSSKPSVRPNKSIKLIFHHHHHREER